MGTFSWSVITYSSAGSHGSFQLRFSGFAFVYQGAVCVFKQLALLGFESLASWSFSSNGCLHSSQNFFSSKHTMPQTMNNSMSTFTLLVALPSSSHSSSTRQHSLHPLVFLCQTTTLSCISRALTDSLPALLLSLCEHVGASSAMSSGSFASSNSISAPSSLPTTIHGQSATRPGTLVVPSFIFTYSTLSSPAVVSSLPSSTRTTFLPFNDRGLFWWDFSVFFHAAHSWEGFF